MEELGLGFSAGFKFDPDDDELVEYYLLPKILRQQLPLDGVIIDDDPLKTPPWKLLPKHKRKDEAFFFANGEKKHDNGSRQNRTLVDGGCWKGQKFVVDGNKLPVPGGTEITWRKYLLNFHLHGKEGSTGWVMHEYSISAPDELASSSQRLYRIRFSGHGQGAKRVPDDYDGGDGGAQAIAEPDHLQQNISAANSVFPAVAEVDVVADEDPRPAATSYSDQDYQYQWTNSTYQMDSFQDFAAPDSMFFAGADVGDYAGPDLGTHGAAPSSDQGAPCVMNQYDCAAPGAGMLPFSGRVDESFMDSFQDLAAPESQFFPAANVGDYAGLDFMSGGNTLNLGAHSAAPSSDQGAPGLMNEYDGAAPAGSFSGGTDESSMDFEPSDMHFTIEELLAFLDEEPLHDQYSSAGMQTQPSMQLMPPTGI
jgi:hypothetical protein